MNAIYNFILSTVIPNLLSDKMTAAYGLAAVGLERYNFSKTEVLRASQQYEIARQEYRQALKNGPSYAKLFEKNMLEQKKFLELQTGLNSKRYTMLLLIMILFATGTYPGLFYYVNRICFWSFVVCLRDC